MQLHKNGMILKMLIDNGIVNGTSTNYGVVVGGLVLTSVSEAKTWIDVCGGNNG